MIADSKDKKPKLKIKARIASVMQDKSAMALFFLEICKCTINPLRNF